MEVSYQIWNIFVYIFCIYLLSKLAVPLYEWMRQRWMLRKVPGKVGLPIVGIALEMLNMTNKEIDETFNIHCSNFDGGLSVTWIAFRPYVVAYSSEMVEPVVSSAKHIDKGDTYEILHDWLGLGLVTSGGRLWQTRRKLLTPTFHFQILDNNIEIFNSHIQKFTSKLNKFADDSPVDVLPLMSACTLDILMETAMGVNLNSQEGGGSEYCDAIYNIEQVNLQRLAKPWLRHHFGLKIFNVYKEYMKCINFMHNFSLGTIRKRKEQFLSNDKNNDINHSGKKKKLSFIDLLLEKSVNNNILSENDIKDEVDTFMFAGHDTITSGLVFCLQSLGCHPEYQKKIREELDDIFGDSDRMPTMEDFKNMNYLECCFKEALRLYPPVVGFFRRLNEDCKLGKYMIPRGTNYCVNVRKLHRDPEVFPNPEEFNPDRFLPENSKGRSPYAYVPFSAGPRNCIGQRYAMLEAKAILSAIFRKFRIESSETMEEKETFGQMILLPLNGKVLITFNSLQ